MRWTFVVLLFASLPSVALSQVELVVSGATTPAEARRLCGAELERSHTLTFLGASEDALRVVLESHKTGAVETLVLFGTCLNSGTVDRLVSAPWSSLCEAQLEIGKFDSGCLRALLESESFSSLESLTLEGAPLSSDDLDAVRRNLLGLRFLRMESNERMDIGPLLRGGGFPALEELHIVDDSIGDDGVAALCSDQTTFPRLARLRLDGVGLTDDGARVLMASQLIPRLTELSLGYSGVSGATLAAGLRRAPRLDSLALSNAPIRDVDLRHILGALDLNHLKYLDLSGTRITDVGAAMLLRVAPMLRDLQYLVVTGTRIEEGFAEELAALYGPKLVFKR